MNTRRLRLAYLAVAGLLALGILAACAPTAPTGTFPPTNSAPAQAPTSAPADTPTAVVAPTSAPTSAPAAAPSIAPTSAPAASAPVTLQIKQNAALGSFLTDGKGNTLYLFLKDTKNTSNCYDACAAKWPPLASAATPVIGSGVNAALIGSTTRKDGSSQVTYNGWPLYYYAPDQQPGDTKGQGVGSVWFVITPTGDAFTGGGSSSAASTGSSGAPAASVMIQLANNSTLGQFLADGKGNTLYLFLKDTKNTSNCYDACATKWPPLISSAKPALGTGVNAALVGTTTRKDGSIQVTYNGWPLYYYAPDQKPGDTKGQGVGSVWYVLTSSGDAFTGGVAPAAPAAPAAAPTAAPNPYHY